MKIGIIIRLTVPLNRLEYNVQKLHEFLFL